MSPRFTALQTGQGSQSQGNKDKQAGQDSQRQGKKGQAGWTLGRAARDRANKDKQAGHWAARDNAARTSRLDRTARTLYRKGNKDKQTG